MISIAHPKVYSVPILLLIGWRGSPYVKKDEPQHNEKGKITRELLRLLGIKYLVIRTKKNFTKISKLLDFAKKQNRPVALLVERNIFQSKKKIKEKFDNKGIRREFVIEELLKKLVKIPRLYPPLVTHLGNYFKYEKNQNIKVGKDFYMIGGMGHSLMVSLGISMNENDEVICLDGDGALLMHFGSIRTSGIFWKKNLKHVVFNNYCHESVGGQRTFSENLSFTKVAKNLGYKSIFKIRNKLHLKGQVSKFLKSKGPSMLEIITNVGTINNLKRPYDFIQIKNDFIKN